MTTKINNRNDKASFPSNHLKPQMYNSVYIRLTLTARAIRLSMAKLVCPKYVSLKTRAIRLSKSKLAKCRPKFVVLETGLSMAKCCPKFVVLETRLSMAKLAVKDDIGPIKCSSLLRDSF